jgi:hypothetical protein
MTAASYEKYDKSSYSVNLVPPRASQHLGPGFNCKYENNEYFPPRMQQLHLKYFGTINKQLL